MTVVYVLILTCQDGSNAEDDDDDGVMDEGEEEEGATASESHSFDPSLPSSHSVTLIMYF